MTPTAPLASFSSLPRMALRTACAAMVGLALGACASQPHNARGAVVPQAMYQPAEASNPYTQTAWALQRWTSTNGAAQALPVGQNKNPLFTIAFTQDAGRRTVSGNAGCTPYSADYTVANDLIILTSEPAATQRPCANTVNNTTGNTKNAKNRRANDAASDRLTIAFLQGLPRIVASALDNYNNPRRLTLTLANGDMLEFGRLLDPIAGHAGTSKLIYVNAQTVPCMGVAPMQCLQVRDDPGQPWQLYYDSIVGFEYQPGSIYRLRVVEHNVPNPPADASSSRWVLDSIVERRAVR